MRVATLRTIVVSVLLTAWGAWAQNHHLQSANKTIVLQGENAAGITSVDDTDAAEGRYAVIPAGGSAGFSVLVGSHGSFDAWFRVKGNSTLSLAIDGTSVAEVAVAGDAWSWVKVPSQVDISSIDLHTISVCSSDVVDLDVVAFTVEEFYLPAGTGPAGSGQLTDDGNGKILREVWLDSGWGLGGYLTRTDPTLFSYEALFEGPVNWGDNYSERLRATVTIPTTGAWKFFIASDNQSELHLINEDGTTTKLCYMDQWVAPREWDIWPGQASEPLELNAGDNIQLVAIHKEGGGLDNLSIGIEGPGMERQVLPGSMCNAPVYTADADAPATPEAPSYANVQNDGEPIVSDQVVEIKWETPEDNVGVFAYKVLRDGAVIGGAFEPFYRDETVEPGMTYSYSLVAIDRMNNQSGVSPALDVATPVATEPSDGTGLIGQYYASSDFTDRQLVQQESVDFDWGTGSPAPGISSDGWSVRWDGFIEAMYADKYVISVAHDDAVRVFVNHKLVIDQFGYVGPVKESSSGKIKLNPGEQAAIRIEKIDWQDDAQIQLRWSSTRQKKSVVPRTQLHLDPWMLGNAIELQTEAESITSPAWLEGRVGAEATSLQATIDGASFDVTRYNDTHFYVDNSSSGSANLGVTLNPNAPVDVTLSADGESPASQNISLTWTPTVINDGGVILIRKNDTLLLTVSGAGTRVEIDVDYQAGTPFTPELVGTPSQKFPFQFDVAGLHMIMAKIDGSFVPGIVGVQVVGADAVPNPGLLMSRPKRTVAMPLEWETSNQTVIITDTGGNENTVELVPYRPSAEVSVTTADPYKVGVRFVRPKNTEIHVGLQAVRTGQAPIYIRLHDETGPIVRTCTVETMRLRLSTEGTEGFAPLLKDYGDGYRLTSTTMTLAPKYPNHRVQLQITTDGAKWEENGLQECWFSTSDMDKNGQLPGYIIVRDGYYLCHKVLAIDDEE